MPWPSRLCRLRHARKSATDSAMKKLLKKIIAAPFVLIAAIIVILEDWLWDDLHRLAAAIGRLPIFRQIESLIAGLPPYAALAIFATPSLFLFPVKLAALWFIAHDQPMYGFIVAVVAKIAGTALIARIYNLTEPKLLLIGWFAWLRERFLTFKTRIYSTIKASRFYRLVKYWSQRFRETLKRLLSNRRSFWKRRWEAATKLSRRWKQPQ